MKQKVTVEIEGFAVGGAGVGKILKADNNSLIGKRGFIPFTIPGEIVTAEIDEEKKNFFNASLISIEKVSDLRINPPCPYFIRCGGCDLQHLAYKDQLTNKKKIILEGLKKENLADIVSTVKNVEVGEPFGYRRRVTLHVNNKGELGFYRRKTREVFEIDKCLIASSKINDLILYLSNNKLKIPKLSVSLKIEEGMQELAIVVDSDPKNYHPDLIKWKDLLLSETQHGKIKSGESIKESWGTNKIKFEYPFIDLKYLEVPTGSFSQINQNINTKIVQKVIEYTKDISAKIIEDLYSGAGNFAIGLGAIGTQVVAVESDVSLVQVGEFFLKTIKIQDKVSFVGATVENYLGWREKRNIDLIIADPPRAGLGKISEQLSYAKNLILVSCHLPSFFRDIKLLIESGWKVKEICPYDMFSQTGYLEVLTILDR